MKDKKKTIVMFGDSLTDYFPMDKLKDIDADIINSGVAGDTIAEMGARLSYDVYPYHPDGVCSTAEKRYRKRSRT